MESILVTRCSPSFLFLGVVSALVSHLFQILGLGGDCAWTRGETGCPSYAQPPEPKRVLVLRLGLLRLPDSHKPHPGAPVLGVEDRETDAWTEVL